MTVNQHIHCTTCGYDLYGLEEHICPECGTAFAPEELATHLNSPCSGENTRWWAVVFAFMVMVGSVLLGRYIPRVYPSLDSSIALFWTIPACIGFFGFALCFLRIIRLREMLFAIIPAEALILLLAGSARIRGSHTPWIDLFVELSVYLNIALVVPWLIGAVLGSDLKRQ